LSGSWGNLPTTRKLIIGGAAAAVLAGIIGLAIWSGRTDYSVLFSDLSTEDTMAIEDELYAARVPFKHSSDGKSIMVPASDVYKMRLRLANKGLPEVGAVGFEGFDKTDFGMTDFIQQLKYQRALQVELGRTITQLKEVMTARVHIVLPRQSVFTENEQPAKASVVLNLRPGARLNIGQTDGIVHLIASAVEGLQKENVTILDTSGRMLATSGEESIVNSSQLEYQRVVESELESQVQEMLDKVLGTNKATIQIAAEIDFSTTETSSEVYDPENTVVKSEKSVEYKSKGGVGGASGVPGVTSNITPTAQSTNTSEHDRADATTEYEVSKTVKHTLDRPGKINKLSVAVVVDNKTVDGVSTPWTQQELKDVEDLVRNAVGMDTTRGDPKIEVRNIPFDTSLQQEVADAEKLLKRERLKDLIMKAAIAIAIFGFLAFAIRSVTRSRRIEEVPALPRPQPAILADVEEQVQLGEEAPVVEAAVVKEEEAPLEPLEFPKSSLERNTQQILALVEKNPEAIAEIIREWMAMGQ